MSQGPVGATPRDAGGPAQNPTAEVLREMLARELAAKVFYEDLCERVVGTEFERFLPELQDMAKEEAEHAEQVRELLAKYG